MPRILRIINRLNLGGPTLNVAYLSKHLAPEFETMLLTGMIDTSEASSEFLVSTMGLQPVYIPEMFREIELMNEYRAYLRVKKIILKFKPDIVHTHAAKAGAIGRMAAAVCKVPVIVHTFHGHVFHSYFSKWKTKIFIEIERYLASRSHAIITLSEGLKKELAEVYKIAPASKITTIPLGFDLERFITNKEAKRIKFRNKYLVAEDEIVIVLVGRLVPIKNHGLFLEALKYLSTKANKKVRGFIVGDGEMRTEIVARAKELEVETVDFLSEKRSALLTLTSWIREVDEVYAGADIVALTSLNEGTPVSLIEAQAAGKPIVTTNVGGIQDILFNSHSAFLTDLNDPYSFYSALLELVENDSLRNSLTGYDPQEILRKFSFGRLIDDTRHLYLQLLNATRKE